MSQVKYRNYTFPSNWSNSVNRGAPANRVKIIRYPGIKGALSLNMRQAERPFVHTGTVRRPSQASLHDTMDDIESLCDGTYSGATGGGGTSFDLIFHGESFSSVYSESVEWGAVDKFIGTGGIAATATEYYAIPFIIRYIELTP